MPSKRPQLLLTNDDGIDSPGLWVAAEALSLLGYVHVVAPRDQSTSMGRSMPASSDGIIEPKKVNVSGKYWTVYAVGGTPAQAVLHGVLEIMSERPDIVVSGINYGENVAIDVTISGTVGAALEAAAQDIPAIAVSLETPLIHHWSNSDEVDFSVSAQFTAHFAKSILEHRMPPDVDVLKIEVPSSATPDTPWAITRLSRRRYYESLAPERKSWRESAKLSYRKMGNLHQFDPNSDVYTVFVKRQVSVTPLSLDLTSRVDMQELERSIRGN